MVITGNELDSTQAALDQAVQKLAPVHFGLRQRNRNTQHPSVPTGGDAHGHQYGAVHHLASFSNAFIARIQQHIGCLIQWAIAPGVKPNVELLRAAADLGRGDADLRAHQLLQHFDDLAGRHPLDVHLSQRQIDGLL
jgi:hypothetical protein